MNKSLSIIEYIFVFFIILEFNTPYLYFTSFRAFLFYLIIILSVVLLFSRSNYRISNNMLLQTAIYCFGAIFPLFISGNKQKFVLLFVVFVISVWLYLQKSKLLGTYAYYSIFRKYSNVVFFLAIESLLFWSVGSFLEILTPTSLFPSTWTQGGYLKFINTYYGIYFETQMVDFFGFQIWRNSGIFQEGPMFNMVLCAALFIECCINKGQSWFSKIKIVVITITIITTFTTTGQFVLIFNFLFFLTNRSYFRKYKMLFIVMLPIFIYGAYLLFDIFYEAKLETTSGDNSVSIRASSIETCIKVGMEEPVWGAGYFVKESDIDEHSNSIFEVFAYGGIYGLILYAGTLLFIPIVFYLKRKDKYWLVLMVGFFIVFSITVSEYKFLTLLYVAWGLSNLDFEKPYEVQSECNNLVET